MKSTSDLLSKTHKEHLYKRWKTSTISALSISSGWKNDSKMIPLWERSNYSTTVLGAHGSIKDNNIEKVFLTIIPFPRKKEDNSDGNFSDREKSLQ